jgi:hypothetical protein
MPRWLRVYSLARPSGFTKLVDLAIHIGQSQVVTMVWNQQHQEKGIWRREQVSLLRAASLCDRSCCLDIFFARQMFCQKGLSSRIRKITPQLLSNNGQFSIVVSIHFAIAHQEYSSPNPILFTCMRKPPNHFGGGMRQDLIYLFGPTIGAHFHDT